MSSTSCSFWYRFSVSCAISFGNSELLYFIHFVKQILNVHSYRRTYMPSSYHIAQELQKYNIPDYRPRQEQYVSLLYIYIDLNLYGVSPDSRKLSRKFVQLSVCDGTAALPLVRQRMANRTRPRSSGLMTHQKRVPDHLVTRLSGTLYFILLPILHLTCIYQKVSLVT